MENRTGWGITCRESSRGWVIYHLLFCIWLEGDRGCFYKASNKFGWYHLRLTGYVGDVLANVVDIFSHNSIHSKLKISFHVLTHIKFHKEVLFLCVDFCIPWFEDTLVGAFIIFIKFISWVYGGFMWMVR